jgi:hypothetical protein
MKHHYSPGSNWRDHADHILLDLKTITVKLRNGSHLPMVTLNEWQSCIEPSVVTIPLWMCSLHYLGVVCMCVCVCVCLCVRARVCTRSE